MICLAYAYIFAKNQARYAYKRHAYKKKHVLALQLKDL